MQFVFNFFRRLLYFFYSDREKGRALCFAAQKGHIAIVADSLQQYNTGIDNTHKGMALCFAAENGHELIVRYLLQQCSADISNDDKGTALIRAAENGHELIVRYLLQQCSADISNSHKGIALFCAADRGHTEIVRYLLQQCSADIRNNHKGIALYNAASHGHTAIVTDLLQQCSADISNDYKGMALYNAAENGHTAIVTDLLQQCSADISNNHKGIALWYAAKNGHETIVRYLLQQCHTDISNDYKGEALSHAAKNGHIDALNALLAYESVVAVATFENNQALREAQMRVNGAENDDERARYQAIIDRLMQIPAVAALAREHANRETDLADITRFAENSMQDLTPKEHALIKHLKDHYKAVLEDKTWEGIRAEILSYLEYEYHQSPAIDGYHYVWMLANDSDIPTDFIPADTIGIHPQGEEATLYWKDIDNTLQQKVVPMSDVVECYQQLNKKNWLHQNAQDADLVKKIIEKFGITPHPRQGEKCPLHYEENQNESRLVAYYRHAVHNAWRYLSDKNPWMSPEARFVETLDDSSRRAIIDDLNKELISYFWIALNDETVQLEPGFSIEGNKNILTAVIAVLNRGHNTDERALFLKDQLAFRNNVPGVKTTTADDLKADAPTCVYGLLKRLLQSQYGHPYINAPEAQPLSLEILLNRMIEQLIRTKEQDAEFDNLMDKLNAFGSKQLLEYIQQQINEICELDNEDEKIMLTEEEEKLYESILSFSEKQIQAFMARTMLWFGKERIEKPHDEKLKLNGSSEFLSKEHVSYKDFIEYCAKNPLHAFTQTIYEYVNKRLEEIEEKIIADDKLVSEIELSKTQEKQLVPILNAYENSCKDEKGGRLTGKKRKRDDEHESDNSSQKQPRLS